MNKEIVYVPIGVGTYHMETADDLYNRSEALLKSIESEILVPGKVLLSVKEVSDYLDDKNPGLVIVQNITFANAAYISEVLRRIDCPLILWTLREPVIDGTRLRSNSLTGAYSAANTIAQLRGAGKFEFVYGSPEEEEVKSELSAIIRACDCLSKMRMLKLSAIGHTPQGFGFGRALDAELLKVFGVTLEAIEARELIDMAKSFSDKECEADLKEAKKRVVGLDKMPDKNVKDFARLYKAYKLYVDENGIGALASRCWPDFFTAYGTPVCMVLSLLNALGVPAACEADVYGALSMYVGHILSEGSVFFGDPVALDENESTITFWHCGMASCDLARCDTGAAVGVHPNRKIGPVMDFGCKEAENATIFRIGRKPNGTFRFMIAEGSILDKPKQFNGASVVVKTDMPSFEIVSDTIKKGFEPHFVVIYGRVGRELMKLANMLGVEIVRY